MSKILNIKNHKFGRLTALEPTDKRSGSSVVWKCRCDCGKICFVGSDNLHSGHTKSCGCLCIERMTTHGKSGTPEYDSWANMKGRCLNPNTKHYKDYGGRGIQVCDRWLKSENFLEDMGERPDGLTLDRINNDGNYEPGNCRWATIKEQASNTRKLKWFYAHGPNGEMVVENKQSEIAQVFGLKQGHISNCLHGKLKAHKGWTFKYI